MGNVKERAGAWASGVRTGNAKEWVKAWASGVRTGIRWVVGEGPKPDQRSGKILLGTAGAVLALIALVALVASSGHPAKVKDPRAQNATLLPAAPPAHPVLPFAPSPAKAPAPTTTVPAAGQGATSSTTASGSKGSRTRARHNAARHQHPKNTAKGQ